MALFHEPKMCQWVHAPGLKGLVGLSTSRRKHKIIGAKINRAVTLCLLLLVDRPTKPLSPGACTHLNIFGS